LNGRLKVKGQKKLSAVSDQQSAKDREKAMKERYLGVRMERQVQGERNEVAVFSRQQSVWKIFIAWAEC
jgi:hypothetical protein